MKRIVVCFSGEGDYECEPLHYTLCFRYESPEKWLEDFSTLLEEHRKSYNIYNKAHEEWWAKLPKRSNHPKHKEKCAEWQKSKPSSPSVVFNFCGHDFKVYEFCPYDLKTKNYEKTVLPDVYELKDWFEINCAN